MCIRNTLFVDSVDNNEWITGITTFSVWIRLWKPFSENIHSYFYLIDYDSKK